MTDTVKPSGRLGSSYLKLLVATVVSNLGDGMASVAYPWLASAITRNPVLIALVAAAQRLPWLVFTLPAGVLTDRLDRRRIMVSMDTARALLTAAVALAVLGEQDHLPGPDALDAVEGTRVGLYTVLVVATMLLGMAEVLRDNANQTILPDLVAKEDLERANGRIWSLEGVANNFAGPPLGSLLLLAAFSLPFLVDSVSFAVAAALVALIPGSFRSRRRPAAEPTRFRTELADGVRWLLGHRLLRTMGLVLGLLNATMMISGATFVLFAQEVLGVGPLLFTVIGFGGAISGLAGGQLAPRISGRLGPGRSLAVAVGGLAVAPALIGLLTWWPATLVLFGVIAFVGILWNVITVSLRQSIIPDDLLGRVNSVYRFFAWGMMPIGAVAGGGIVAAVTPLGGRDLALRSTFFASALIQGVLFVVTVRSLTTQRIEEARAAA